jgi:uncharacterized phage-associated protein
MFYDELYSLPHGPICSNVLDGLNGKKDAAIWAKYITRKDAKTINIAHKVERRDLDEISDSDLNALKTVWDEFGHMTANEIRAWTHDHCDEYVEVPEGSSLPITYKDLFSAVGYDNAAELQDSISHYRKAEARLGS